MFKKLFKVLNIIGYSFFAKNGKNIIEINYAIKNENFTLSPVFCNNNIKCDIENNEKIIIDTINYQPANSSLLIEICKVIHSFRV